MSGGARARAAVAFERGAPLRIEEISVREPGPGEVRVRIAACGICASDLHVWRTGEGIEFPAVLGHEASGVVEAVGPGTSEVALGQSVVLAWIPRCGACRACRAGRTHLCTALQTNAADGSLSLGVTVENTGLSTFEISTLGLTARQFVRYAEGDEAAPFG